MRDEIIYQRDNSTSTIARGVFGETVPTIHGCPAIEFKRFLMRRAPSGSDAQTEGNTASSLRRTPKLARLEAVLFVAGGAMSTRKLVQTATLADTDEARSLIERLNRMYDASDSPFRVERVARGYQLLTRPRFAPWLNRIHQRKSELKLSPPAMETLTIVAYRQKVTRADIEAVRGVQCSEMLKQLMERGLVRIAGEDDSLGRPYLYETSGKFLELFGLRDLNDLPMAKILRHTRKKAPPPDVSGLEVGEEIDDEELDDEEDDEDFEDDDDDDEDLEDDELDEDEFEDDEQDEAA